VGLSLGGIFFRKVVFSRFDLLLGDVGDARLNGVILEHWWQVLQGTAPWLSPTFFFPVQGVLGYSDAGFLNALPYVVLRFIAIDPFTSCQIVLFSLVAVGWIGTILFFRCCLRLRIFPTIIGAALFVFPNAMANSTGHTQLFSVYFIPYLAIGIHVFLQNFKKPTSIGIIAGIFVAIIVPALFYTSYYIGWFSLFFLLLFSGICFAWGVLRSGGKTVWQCIICKRENWRKILPYCVLSTICFTPFLLTYIPVLKQFGGRSYHVITSMLPTFIDYMNVGPDNWLWGKTLYATFAGIGSRPMAHELIKGVPVCLLLVSLAFSVYFILKTSHYQLTVTQDGTCKIVVGGNANNDDGKLAMLAVVLGISVLLAWLLMLKIQGFSLWWLVLKLIPGAGGIRAVYRFQHVLVFPIAIVVAIGLHQSINYAAGHIHSYVRQRVWLGCIALFCLLLLVEQFNIGSLANYSKQQQLEMIAGVSPPPQQAEFFALLPAKGLKKLPYEAQIDAMIIAQKFGLHTINGYSSLAPIGWGEIYDLSKEEYIVSLARWIQHYNLENDRLYFLNVKTGEWLSVMNMKPSLHKRVVFMNGPLSEKDFSLELSTEKVPTQWQKNELRQCTLLVKNNGNVTLSSFGGDFYNPGKYAIRLSYRWIEAESSVQSLYGFDTRTALPMAVKPNALITLNMEIKAPSRQGEYWLEIEAVQELVAWYKDKGSPGILIEAEVR
jgi:hypothetical protein